MTHSYKRVTTEIRTRGTEKTTRGMVSCVKVYRPMNAVNQQNSNTTRAESL